MSSQAPQAQAFDSDPPTIEHYHQDYIEGRQSVAGGSGFWVVLVLCALPAIYQTFHIFGFDIPPILELLWNILVYLTPSRLLDAIEDRQNPLRDFDSTQHGLPRTHFAKSEILRRFIFERPGSILDSVTQVSKRIPSFNVMNMTSFDSSGAPVGLGNNDNSCYQNSILQGLAALDTLPEYLANTLGDVEGVEGSSKPDLPTVKALSTLIGDLNNPESNGRSLWTPPILKNMESRWQQQDAQEYISTLLDAVEKEIGQVASKSTSPGFSSDETVVATPPWATYQKPWEGLAGQRVACTKCGYCEGLTMTAFSCLTLTPGKVSETDIKTCLNEFAYLIKIPDVNCPKCTLVKFEGMLQKIIPRINTPGNEESLGKIRERLAAVTTALEEDDFSDKTLTQDCCIPKTQFVNSVKTKQSVFARLPKSLFLHVNRSIYDAFGAWKNEVDLRFPKFLDVGPWTLGSFDDGETSSIPTEAWNLDPEQSMAATTDHTSRWRGPIYELRAVVTHQGRHDNGHYICYRKRKWSTTSGEETPEHWWRLSDSQVNKVTEEYVLELDNAYMLFYDLVRPAVPVESDVVDGEKVDKYLEALQQTSSEDVQIQASGPAIPEEILELVKATNTPLPDIDDEDLFDSDSQGDGPNRSKSEDDTATETETDLSETENGESDIGEKDETGLPEYQPTKPIVIPLYMRQPGIHDEDGTSTEQKSLGRASELVMV